MPGPSATRVVVNGRLDVSGCGVIPLAELAEHLGALSVLVVALGVPGWLLSRLTARPRRPLDGIATWPLLGACFWAVALYALPFRDGLIVAVALIGILGGTFLLRTSPGRTRLSEAWTRRAAVGRRSRTDRFAALILAVGCLSFATPLVTRHVPNGMDAARYMTSTRRLAQHKGLPRNWSPFAPEIPFGAANHAVPTLASPAVILGMSPASAILAAIPICFAGAILGLYTVLRLLVPPASASVVAVMTVWLGASVQRTISWGGFPSVLALGVGLLATRLLVDVLRGRGRGLAVALGLTAGAMPLIHGCIAAGWSHIAAPIALLTGLVASRRRQAGLLGLAGAAGGAAAVLGVYWLAGRPGLDEQAVNWIRTNELDKKLPEQAHQLIPLLFDHLTSAMGPVLSVITGLALCVLATRRRWRVLAVVAGLFILSGLVIALTWAEAIPTALLLYPTRICDWAILPAALAMASAWRVLRPTFRKRRRLRAVLVGMILLVAFSQNVRYAQRTLCRPIVSEPVWHALRWCAEHLDPAADLVATVYGTGAAYLPGVAGVMADQTHFHLDQLHAAKRMRQDRRPTHVFLIERHGIGTRMGREQYDVTIGRLERLRNKAGGALIYEDGPVRIYRIGIPAGATSGVETTPSHSH